MKKIFKKLPILVITLVLISSLTSCGGLLNGDKILSVKGNTEDSFTTNLTLTNIYFLSYDSGSNAIWETWEYDSSYMNNYYLYALELDDKGDNTYYVKDSEWYINNKSYGYGHHSEDSFSSAPDAYMLGTRYYSSNDYYDNISNIITKENYIKIVHDDPDTWPPDFWLSQTDSDDGSTSSTRPSSGHMTNIGSYDRLWVNLDGKIWVCLGCVN